MDKEEVQREIRKKFALCYADKSKWLHLADETFEFVEKLLKPKNQTDFKEGEIDLPLDKLNLFNQWMQYRRSIRKTIKAPGTITKLVKKFNQESIESISLTVNHSIENGYQGLFWDKFKAVKNGADSKTRQVTTW